MAEDVSTGGIKKFHYESGQGSRLDEHRRKQIREAYERYEIRVEKEKKRKLLWILLVVVVILIGISLYLSYN